MVDGEVREKVWSESLGEFGGKEKNQRVRGGRRFVRICRR